MERRSKIEKLEFLKRKLELKNKIQRKHVFGDDSIRNLLDQGKTR